MIAHGPQIDAEMSASLSATLCHLSERLSAVSKEISALSPYETEVALAQAIETLISISLSVGQKNAPSSSRVQPIRRMVEKFIESRLSCSDLSAVNISTQLEIPRSTLYKSFTDEGGIVKYIQNRRLCIARSLLLRPDECRSLEQIASSLGFANCATFSKAFRKRFGRSPRSMRAFSTNAAALSGQNGACRNSLKSGVIRRQI